MTQQTIFTHEADPFTINPVSLLELSPVAYYLYGYIKSKPSGWVFHREYILKEVNMSKDRFYKGLKELEAEGYLTREQINKKGRFGTTIYTLHNTKNETNNKQHRVLKNRIRKNRTHNYINNKLDEEKTQKDKKKSQSDNCKTPSGFTSGNSNKGDNMPTLDEMITKSKNKTKESKERIAEKKKVRSPVFEKPKNNALILEKYLYDKLTPEQLSCLYYRTDKDPYMFEASCKKVGITSLEDQKYILDYCYDNWERVRRCVAFYIDIDDIPNLFYLSHFFFLIGLYTHGFGMKFGIQRFKKETSIEKNN